jgi:hypothetical protein
MSTAVPLGAHSTDTDPLTASIMGSPALLTVELAVPVAPQ